MVWAANGRQIGFSQSSIRNVFYLIFFSRPLFEGDNEFCLCLKESFPNLKTRKLTRVEWGTIRRLMGKPRRYAAVFQLPSPTQHFDSLCLIFIIFILKWLFFLCIFFFITLFLQTKTQKKHCALLSRPGVRQRSLLRSGRRWDRRGRRCACCSKENCLTCQTAKTFQMKFPCLSS